MRFREDQDLSGPVRLCIDLLLYVDGGVRGVMRRVKQRPCEQFAVMRHRACRPHLLHSVQLRHCSTMASHDWAHALSKRAIAQRSMRAVVAR